MARGVSPRQSRNPDCSVCKCTPCQCHTFEQMRQHGQNAYDVRTGKITPATPARTSKKKPAPKVPKATFIRNLKKKNPTISDSKIKKALREAGYPTGCGVIALLTLTTPVGGMIWGGVEIAQAVWG